MMNGVDIGFDNEKEARRLVELIGESELLSAYYQFEGRDCHTVSVNHKIGKEHITNKVFMTSLTQKIGRMQDDQTSRH